MADQFKWITPFSKQCFVTLGQVLSMGQFGLVMGFTSSLLLELRRPDSQISADAAVESWIVSSASILAPVTVLVGATLMGKCGRKITNIIILVVMIISWLIITAATSVTHILLSRILQGVALCIILCVAPVCVGEYTSPKNRGLFLSCIVLSLACGTLSAHTMGSFLSWQKRSLISAVISFVNLLIIIYSPETPSWLIDKGRYDEATKSFIWLRGEKENDELKRMIEANMLMKESKHSSPSKFKFNLSFMYLKQVLKEPVFYKPILLMIHMHIIMHFCGINVITAYGDDMFGYVVRGIDVSTVIIVSDTLRIVISIICSMFVVTRMKRKTLLAVGALINIVAYLLIAVYVYYRDKGVFPNMPYLGAFLLNILMLSIAAGTLIVPFIIAGEIFALRYRSISSVICTSLSGVVGFFLLKTAPGLIRNIGFHGFCTLYAGFMMYALVISWIFLPETKDRTLQDIEEEFRGKKKSADVEVVHMLTGTVEGKN